MRVVVVGGGPAGMVCAAHLSKYHEVTLLERNDRLGKKLCVTGNGRCNITNRKNNKNLIAEIHQGRFLYSALNQVNAETIINYFESQGVPLKEEDQQRMFPVSNKATDILRVLENQLNDVDVRLDTLLTDIIIEYDTIVKVVTTQGEIEVDKVVMATGGVTYPQLGSDGLGHKILKKQKVSITQLYPVECSLISQETFIQERTLQGLSLANKRVTLVSTNKTVQGDLLFTHYGLSGPAILKISEHVYHLLEQKKQAVLSIQLLDDYHQTTFFDYLTEVEEEKISDVLRLFLPKRLVTFILNDDNRTIKNISYKERRRLIESLFNFKVEIDSVMDIKKAFVTGGGVDLREINPQTFGHRRIRNLYVIGELLDLHGSIGGYNLTIAMVTAQVCAQAISSS